MAAQELSVAPPLTGEMFFSTNAEEFAWWLVCDDPTAIEENICLDGRLILLLDDRRPPGEVDIFEPYTLPPFYGWNNTLNAFSRLSLEGNKFTWLRKKAIECDL